LGKRKKEIIDSYYNITLYEYFDGLSLNDIEKLKQDYIDKELYLECEGIQRAIDFIKIIDTLKNTLTKNEDYGNENY